MKRKISVTLEMWIEDGAIVCRDDPDMDKVVEEMGSPEKYVEYYVTANFKEMMDGDVGAWENIRAFTPMYNIVSVHLL